MKALLGIFHRGIEEKYYLALNIASNGDFGSLTIEKGEELIENLPQSNQSYNREYDISYKEPKNELKSDDQRIKEMSDKLDKLILASMKQVRYVGDFDGNQEVLVEGVQEGHEEINYIQGQGYYQKGFNPNYRTHPNLSYRNTNMENPQDQIYPPKQQAFIPQQVQGFVPQQAFVPKQQYFSNQVTPANQATTSTQPASQDQELKALVQRVLDGQIKSNEDIAKRFHEVNSRIDGVYQELDGKITSLASHVKTIDVQLAQFASSSKAPIGVLPGKPESNHRSNICNVVMLEEDKGWRSRYGPLTKEDYEEDELYLEELASLLEPPQEVNVIVKKEYSRKIELVKKRAMETPTYEERQHKPKLDLPRPDFTKAVKRILASYKKDMEDIGIKFQKEDDYKRIAKERDLITDVLANQGKVREVMMKYQTKGEKDKPRTLEKKLNPEKFMIACTLGDLEINDALCDSGLNVNVISREMMDHLGITKLKKTPCSLIFGDATCKQPLGVVEDYHLKISNCIIPTNLMVMEMEIAKSLPLILGTPFLATTRASLDFLHMKALLINVDPYTYYDIEPIEVGICGMVYSEDVKEEMMSLETSEEIKKVVKEAPKLDDYKESLDLFDGGGIGSMFEVIKEASMVITNKPNGADGKSSEMSKEKAREKFTLEPIERIGEELECKAVWNGELGSFYKAKIVFSTSMNREEVKKCKNAMKEAFDIDLEDWEPSKIDGSPLISN
ncbi:hypothetical protein AALP_AA6G160200 [Arabis alpina]|uniref:Aspartic peptidase DDI1-type domain-containing protein n=1 Tax=Arabis alpina TaxID=50452 RepID=A0A087GPJ5_ARAAL|nr:hypothetical protein AALP_AA6G160200 [Arabis alpina]